MKVRRKKASHRHLMIWHVQESEQRVWPRRITSHFKSIRCHFSMWIRVHKHPLRNLVSTRVIPFARFLFCSNLSHLHVYFALSGAQYANANYLHVAIGCGWGQLDLRRTQGLNTFLYFFKVWLLLWRLKISLGPNNLMLHHSRILQLCVCILKSTLFFGSYVGFDTSL